jgi:predicted enzyme related to lactoylglutathione lyase
MQMKLELVPLPVADIDRAKDFYIRQLGFSEDVDVSPAEGLRVVQLTPPGSACSIGLGTGFAAYGGEPGSVRALHLVVADIEEARDALVERGVAVGDIEGDGGGGVRFAGFSDPDGNGWVLQEMSWRTGEAY